MKKIKLAIFDIDGTIFRSSLVIELVRALVRHGVFPTSADREMQKEYLAWLDRRGSYNDYINKVVKIYIKYIKGKNFKAIDSIARRVIKFQKDRVYRFTRDLIKQLKRQKYFLVAISGSPSYIVEEYAKAIGFDKFYGTELEIKDGKFTGKVLNLDSAFKKKKVLMAFVETLTRPGKPGQRLSENSILFERSREPVSKISQNFTSRQARRLKFWHSRTVSKVAIDWKQSIAVGDTESDVEMLSLVGNPIAFNPNHQLAVLAKKKEWKIVVERKDVVYEIIDFRFKI